MMATVLIVDDEKDIVNALEIYLSPENYEIMKAYTGEEAVQCVKNNKVDLILMDVMMPVMDGIEATKVIREFSNVPIILLTAKSEEADKILGLDIGADDYITKPFNPAEVIARIHSQLRRYTRLGGVKEENEYILRNGGIEMNDREKKVTVDDKEVTLTPTEYAILKLLLEHPGQVFSAHAIYQNVWNEVPIGSEGSIAVHIRHLREKIEFDPSNPHYVIVVWGQGYRMEEKK